MSTIPIQLIIPCYNEANRLPTDEFVDFLKKEENNHIHFLFVNDGSKDDTLIVINKLAEDFKHVEVLDLKKNGGKAEAIRQGMLYSRDLSFKYVGFFDADLAAPLQEIKTLIDHGKIEQNPYLIIGARVKLLGSTKIDRKISRHYIGRIFATIVSNMLQLAIYDTQCGAKLVRIDLIETLFNQSFLSKWLFDVELFFRIKKNYQDFKDKIIEVPLKKWEDKAGSKISLSYYFKAPFDLLKIYFTYK